MAPLAADFLEAPGNLVVGCGGGIADGGMLIEVGSVLEQFSRYGQVRPPNKDPHVLGDPSQRRHTRRVLALDDAVDPSRR